MNKFEKPSFYWFRLPGKFEPAILSNISRYSCHSANDKYLDQELLKQVEESQALAERIKQLTEDKNKLTTMTGLLKQQIAAYDKQVKPLKAQNRELSDKITILQVPSNIEILKYLPKMYTWSLITIEFL